MEEKKFRKLLKEKSPQRIIGMHTHWIIKLSDKQLDLVLKRKNNA